MTQSPGARLAQLEEALKQNQGDPLFNIVSRFDGQFKDEREDGNVRRALSDPATTPGSAKKNSGSWTDALGTAVSGSILNAIPGIGPILGTGLTLGSGAVTPYAREAVLKQKLAGNLTMTDGRYDQLGLIDRRLLNITDQQLSNVKAADRLRKIQNNDVYQDAFTYLRDPNEGGLTEQEATKRLMPDGAGTSVSRLRAAGRPIDEQFQLTNALRNDVEGSTLLQSLREGNDGKPLSLAQLRETRNSAVKKGQGYRLREQELNLNENKDKRDENKDKRDAATNTELIASSQSTRQTNERIQTLAEIQARNAQKNTEAEIDFKNDTNEYNWRIANREIDEARESSQLDRNLRRDLAVLGIDDKQNERQIQAERDERRDRQLLMLQLMKGLGNLGSVFAL